jgi:hypothetical protein
MKEPEYIEGPKALENFERGMKALFSGSQDGNKKGEAEG